MNSYIDFHANIEVQITERPTIYGASRLGLTIISRGEESTYKFAALLKLAGFTIFTNERGFVQAAQIMERI